MAFLILAGGALALGMLFILLIARYSPPIEGAAQPVRSSEAGGDRPSMPYMAFRTLVIDLLEALRFEVVQPLDGTTELDIYCRNPEPLRGGRYIVYAILQAPGGIVDSSKLYRLRDLVRAEGAAKGILMTPLRITDEKIGSLEEVSLEAVPGSEMRKLIEKYLPDRVAEIDQYSGFGR